MSRHLQLQSEYKHLGTAFTENDAKGGENATPKRKNDENAVNSTPTTNNVQQLKRVKAVPSSITKSALPRYQSARLKALEQKKVANVASAASSNRSPLKGMLSSVMERGAKAFLNIVSSPSASVHNKSGANAECTPALEAHIEGSAAVPSSSNPSIRELFDSAYSIDEERVIAIMGGLRCKSKWDTREKVNKQAAVITELRAALKTTFEETRSLKEKSVAAEANLSSTLQRMIAEFAMSRQQVGLLSKEDVRLKQEIKDLSDAIKSLQSEKKDATQRAYEADATIKRLQIELSVVEGKCSQRDMENAKLSEELSRSRLDAQDALAQQKEEFDQRIEQALGGYKDEVASLRSELGRSSLGKAEIARQATEQKEELLNAYSQIRELKIELERKFGDNEDFKAEISALKESLVSKEADMRAALKSLQDFQKITADEKVQLRAEISSLQGKLVHFEDDRLSCASQLAAKIEEISSYARENSRLKEKLSQKEEELQAGKDSHLLLEVEKDLRVRAEIREENERRERIASTAQLLAVQSECAEKIHRIEEQASSQMASMKQTLKDVEAAREAAVRDLSEAHNVAAGRMSEILSLKSELEKASVNSEAQEQLASLRGEMEMVKRRLQEKLNLQLAEGSQTAARVKELENQLVDAENQRRKLRNIIAELKGNVRVFARVRPYLPNDGVDPSTAVDSSIAVSGDNASVRIHSSKGDDQLFTFDKAFGPSSSQESVFVEVSEFVQSALDGYHGAVLKLQLHLVLIRVYSLSV